MKDKTKIIILILFCLIFAILMIVGWVMYAKAKESDVTGLLVIMYPNDDASLCKEFTTKGASSLLVVPFDTCVPSGGQYLKLIESNGKYIVSQYKDPECTEVAPNGIITFNIDEIGKCVDIPQSSDIAIAYKLYGPIKPYFFYVSNDPNVMNKMNELINGNEICNGTLELIKKHCTDSSKCITTMINRGNTYYQS